MSHLAVLHLHMTQIVVVVGEDGLTLRAGPLRLRGRLSAAPRRGRVIPRGLVVLICVIIVIVFLLLFFLFLFSSPVLSVGVVRFSGGFGFETGGTGCVGRGRGGVRGVGLGLCLFG